MEKLNIYQVKAELNYGGKPKEVRATRKWCMRNGVEIFKVGKNEFVLKEEFEKEYFKLTINRMRIKYGSGWESKYKLNEDEDFNYMEKEVYDFSLKNKMAKTKKKHNYFDEEFENYKKAKAA